MELSTRHAQFIGLSPAADPFIAPVTANPHLPAVVARQYALIAHSIHDVDQEAVARYRTVLTTDGSYAENASSIALPSQFDYLATGDIVRLNPGGSHVRVLYRRSSRNNSLLLTERCNSFCLMCSQPPRNVDDSHLASEVRQAIELMDRGTESLGLTGGEPALLGNEFLRIVQHARNFLPDTRLHVLTNGRLFKDPKFARDLAHVGHPNLMLGIPLYSAQPDHHDFVVQAQNAFDETVKGILNLKAAGIGIELRVVIHKQTYEGLPELAGFVARNLAFVDYVALMGLELVGFAKSNMGALWIDPYDYRDQLETAVRTLSRAGVPALVYNHQLCIVPEAVRPYCVKSISDWKNEYLEVCESCSLKQDCGGFFSTGRSLEQVSSYIAPV